jgi:8-oxo-dGTP pyrophosphatase MutT (NUDIX family)
MEECDVVTCFLRNRGAVLLLRRSHAVGSYRGRWGTVAGYVATRGGAGGESTEPDRGPETAAREEIDEETGLGGAVTLVRRGDVFAVPDDALGVRWRVHPFLFDCASRDVATNEETSEAEWAPPTELLRRETVPELWRAYDAVRPTVESVADDREHGSGSVSIRALEVLRDEAALAIGDENDWATAVTPARP